jgi:hypothetical protein
VRSVDSQVALAGGEGRELLRGAARAGAQGEEGEVACGMGRLVGGTRGGRRGWGRGRGKGTDYLLVWLIEEDGVVGLVGC